MNSSAFLENVLSYLELHLSSDTYQIMLIKYEATASGCVLSLAWLSPQVMKCACQHL